MNKNIDSNIIYRNSSMCEACRDGLPLVETTLSGFGDHIFLFHVVPYLSEKEYKDSGLRCSGDGGYFPGCACQTEPSSVK